MDACLYRRRSKQWMKTLRQLQNGVFVSIRKAFFRRFPIRQPNGIQMFAGSKDDRKFFRYQQSENMFRIFGYTRCESMPPDGKNFENVFSLPVFQAIEGNFMLFRIWNRLDNPYACFFKNFPYRCFFQRLGQRIPRTCYRLPETGTVGTLDQQNIEFFRINHDKNRLGNFIGHVQNETRERVAPFPFFKPVEPFLFSADECAVPATVFH